MRILLFIIVFLIAYGSLYPFDFEPNNISYDRLINTLFSGNGLFRISDMISNIVLFIPYGIVCYFRSEISGKFKLNLLFLIIFGIAFSLLLQILQLYLPSRVVAFSDVIWNTLGIILGLIISQILRNKILLFESRLGYLYSPQVFLIACWVASALIPFIPTLQVDQVRDNVKELIASSFYFNEIVFQFLGWLICLYWFISLSNKIFIFYVLICVTLIAKIFLVDNLLTLNIIIGSLCVIIFGKWIIRYIKKYNFDGLLAFFMIIMIMLNSFNPLAINYEFNDFHWVPFSGFLEGSMLINAQSLCEKTFIYGSLVWLLNISSSQIKIATIFVSILLLFVEILQIFIANGTPEITDPVLVLLISYVLYFIEKTKLDNNSLNTFPVESVVEKHKVIPEKITTGFSILSFKAIYLPYIVILIFFSALIRMALSFPQVPYNIRELFSGGGSFISIFIFLNVLLWIGVSAVICAHFINKSKFQFLAFPGYVMLSGLVSLALLYQCVTEESLSDIVGSKDLYRSVTEKKVWGEIGEKIIFSINAPALVNFFERVVRYLALYSPVVFSLVIVNLINDQEKISFSKILLRLFYFLLISFPWLYLCKTIAFTYASTDNLYELIAPSGEYSIGGGVFLYLLLFLVSINSVLLARIDFKNVVRVAFMLILTLLAIPIGWYLINAGLVTNFKKYGIVYSGVDFILGPDRSTLLSRDTLFFRWSLVQVGAVLILSYGQRVMLQILKKIAGNSVGNVEY